MDDRETIPCAICGRPTPMLGTKRCDLCWEIERRMGECFEQVVRHNAREYVVRVYSDEGGIPPNDYRIFAGMPMEARIIAFIMDGGLPTGQRTFESDEVELVKMHTEIMT
ncbi:MAG: hypothetical protein ACYS7Y_04325 [Planctomycetota bacterium]|jgi:hypothetical protein